MDHYNNDRGKWLTCMRKGVEMRCAWYIFSKSAANHREPKWEKEKAQRGGHRGRSRGRTETGDIGRGKGKEIGAQILLFF